MSRLWDAAPAMEGVEQEQAEVMAENLLKEHEANVGEAVRPIGSLLLTLARVKKTRVTFLELSEFDDKITTREAYNDAVVNIFTRLNTAGRTLTREDITFAWLKVGWVPEKTGNRSAAECFDSLAEALTGQKLNLEIEDLVAGVSLVWSVFHGDGRLLSNNDLLKGDAIRPMAADLSNNWATLKSAIEKASENVADRGYRLHEHYESLNSIFILWAWQYIASQWSTDHTCKELEKDHYEKLIGIAFASFADRWLMCSQWAGKWEAASAVTIAGYVKRLSECAIAVRASVSPAGAACKLHEFLETEVKSLEGDALAGLNAIQVRRRELVRVYYAPLWIWHRLDTTRWKMSKIQLRTHNTRKKMNLDVDHAVAYALWEHMLTKELPTDFSEKEDALPVINRMGNCSLLEKSFNISKSDRTMKSFLDEVHEFKTGKFPLTAWLTALDLPATMVDANAADVNTIVKAITERDSMIRKELAEFVRGERRRVDLNEGP